MSESALNIMDKGIACLYEHLGLVEMEAFISAIQREKFDYTKWHQRFADTVTESELDELCKRSAAEHPFQGNPSVIV